MKLSPPDVRASSWGDADGAQTPIVRVHAGGKMLAIRYEDIPKMIADLAGALHDHNRFVDGLVIDE